MKRFQVCILEQQGDSWRHGFTRVTAASEKEAHDQVIVDGGVDDDLIFWGEWHTAEATPTFRVLDVRAI